VRLLQSHPEFQEENQSVGFDVQDSSPV